DPTVHHAPVRAELEVDGSPALARVETVVEIGEREPLADGARAPREVVEHDAEADQLTNLERPVLRLARLVAAAEGHVRRDVAHREATAQELRRRDLEPEAPLVGAESEIGGLELD